MPADFYAVRLQTDRILALLLVPALGVSVVQTYWFVSKLLLVQAHSLRSIRRRLAECHGQCGSHWEECLPAIAKEVAHVRDLLSSTHARLAGVPWVKHIAPAIVTAVNEWDDYADTLAVSSDQATRTLLERVAHAV